MPRGTRNDQELNCGVLSHHLSGKFLQILIADGGFDKIGFGRGLFRKLTYFDLAVLRHGAYRDDARLITGKQRYGSVNGRTHLEEGAITRAQSQRQQGRTQSVSRHIQFVERYAAVVTDEGGLGRTTASG